MLHLERLGAEITALTQQAAQAHHLRIEEVETAVRWLQEAPPPDELRRLAQPLLGPQSEWDGAIPATEETPLDQRVAATEMPIPGTAVIAVDGSQIFPDRHAPLVYALLQVGSLTFRYNGQAPTPNSQARLYYEDQELFDEKTGLPVSPQRWGMRRTVWELQYLAEQAHRERETAPEAPILTWTDGPLLWSYIERTKEDAEAFRSYLEALTRLSQAHALPIGYVERPGGRRLIELLWLSRLDSRGAPRHPGETNLHTLTDQTLMARILEPGERSAWLDRPSPINLRQTSYGHPIWFCYMNLGEPGYPVIARIEAPAWVAQRDDAVINLQAALWHQARLLSGYPYILARAHEEALVTTEDKTMLEGTLLRHLWQQGIPVRPSEKARQKGNLGRKR